MNQAVQIPKEILEIARATDLLLEQNDRDKTHRKKWNCISRALVAYSLFKGSSEHLNIGLGEFYTNLVLAEENDRLVKHYVCVVFRHNTSAYYIEYNPLFYSSIRSFQQNMKFGYMTRTGRRVKGKPTFLDVPIVLKGFNGFLDDEGISRLKAQARERNLYYIE